MREWVVNKPWWEYAGVAGTDATRDAREQMDPSTVAAAMPGEGVGDRVGGVRGRDGVRRSEGVRPSESVSSERAVEWGRSEGARWSERVRESERITV